MEFYQGNSTKDQERNKYKKKNVSIRKSRYIKLYKTHCCTGKFNIALSLCRVLRVALYFSTSFSDIAAKVLWFLGVTMVCFLEQEFSL